MKYVKCIPCDGTKMDGIDLCLSCGGIGLKRETVVCPACGQDMDSLCMGECHE